MSDTSKQSSGYCFNCAATVANGGRENLHYRPVIQARVSPRGIRHWVNNMGVTLCGKDGRKWPLDSNQERSAE